MKRAHVLAFVFHILSSMFMHHFLSVVCAWECNLKRDSDPRKLQNANTAHCIAIAENLINSIKIRIDIIHILRTKTFKTTLGGEDQNDPTYNNSSARSPLVVLNRRHLVI